MVAATPPIPGQPSAPAKRRSAPGAMAMALWLYARDSWLTIDLRALAVFRIAFGVALIGNLYDHSKDGHLVAFFTNHGVLTNHLALQAPIQPRPWSLLFAFSLPGELRIAFFAIFVVYVLYAIGWKTKLMQVLVIICFVSLVNRNLLLQDGGSFVSTLLSVWTVFLPLGARYSVDHWLATRPTADEESATAAPSARQPSAAMGRWPADAPRHVSFVCLALMLQLAVIYAFNAANKTGITWRDGTAVHYVLWQNGTNTELAGFLRYHEPAWFSPLLTRGTLLFEWAAPVLVLTPVFRTISRRVLIVSMCLFHIGIALLMSLGPFSYAMMAYSALLLTPPDFAFLEPKMRSWTARLGRTIHRRSWLSRWRAAAEAWRARTGARNADDAGLPIPAPGGGFAWQKRFSVARVAVREGLAILLFVAMLTELTIANANVPKRLRLEDRPEWMSEILYYLRIYQTWGMFSSDPPLDSGTVVVDATLADGSHIDPLTGRPPDLEAPLHGPWLMGHDWSEFIFYYPWDRHRVYRDGLRDYVARQDEDQGWPAEKKIRSFSLYWVSAVSPPPGSVQPHDLKRELLLSYVARAR